MKAIAQVFSFDLLSKLLLGGIGILLIRYMPASEYAAYTFALSLVAFVTQSIAATFNRIYILASPHDSVGDAWAVIGFQGALIALLSLFGLPLVATLGASYWLVVTLALATCASEFAKTHFQKDLNFAAFSLIEVARSALFFVAALVLIWCYGSRLTANEVIVAQAASLFVVALTALRGLRGQRGTARTLSLAELRRHAQKFAVGNYGYLFAYFFVVGIFTQTDIFMLKIVGDELMLATYGSAFRYYSILSLALAAVHAVLLPMIQRAPDAQELKTIFARHRRFVAIFALGTAVAAGLGQWVIPWIDTGRYADAPATFSILCASAVISFAFSPHVNLLMRYERFKFLIYLVIPALLVHVLISAVLIPRVGAIGAATSLLVSSALITFSIYLKSRRLTLNPETLAQEHT